MYNNRSHKTGKTGRPKRDVWTLYVNARITQVCSMPTIDVGTHINNRLLQLSKQQLGDTTIARVLLQLLYHTRQNTYANEPGDACLVECRRAASSSFIYAPNLMLLTFFFCYFDTVNTLFIYTCIQYLAAVQ